MSALNEERDTAKREGKIIVLGAKAGVKIYAGAMVAKNADGLAVPAADAAGLVVVGRAAKTVDNTNGQDNDLQVEAEQGLFLYDAAGLTAADAGKDCFAADDQTVALAGGNNSVFAGVLVEVQSATEAWVLIAPGVKVTPSAVVVPEAAVVAAVATADAAAQGAAYVQADAQTVAALANANKTAINAILTALKAAGLMAAE